MKKENLLSDWVIHQYDENTYYLTGFIFNDSKGRFKNGMHVHTSQLVSIDFKTGIAHTKNSTYNLEVL